MSDSLKVSAGVSRRQVGYGRGMVKVRHRREIRDVAFQSAGRPAARVECLRLPQLFAKAGAQHWEGLESLQFHAWLVFTAGRCTHLVDFERYACKPGTVLHIEPGQLHRWDPTPGLDGYVLLLSSAGREARRGELGLPRELEGAAGCRVLRPLHRARVVGWFEQLARETAGPDALSWHLALVALLDVARSSEGATHGEVVRPGPGLARVTELRRLIERSFRVTRTARDYAAALGCSLRTLDRTCVAATGTPVKALVDARVLLEARRRLAHTDVTLEALASELGFSEATHLAKFFRRHAGMTAGRFRQPFRVAARRAG